VARDYYQLLGVDRDASDGDIKRAYRKLARELHPDVTGDDPRATERFKLVTEAYETLSDPQRKKSYDRFGNKDHPPPPGPGFGVDVDGLIDQLFPGRKKKPRPSPGIDMEKPLSVSFVEAWTGASKQLGSIKVVVPAGVDDGTRLRLKGQGAAGEHGGPNGDLYVVISVGTDARFRRDGVDVYVDVKVPLATVLLGGTAEVPLPDGTARLTVPANTQGGQLFRLRGKGFAKTNSSVRGDLLATIQVQIPTVPADAIDDVKALLARLT
jgi:DnaJ-class molecular chaperone